MIATAFIAVTLACVVLLTQSLRFLELVINSGASGGTFWILTALALPRFFEVILPIALMAGTVFVYNRLAMDSELIVMKAAGASPMTLARPALSLSAAVAVLLWIMTTWLAPVSLSGMHQLRQIVKAQYSALMFREGVFTALRPGLTAYIRERGSAGELRGIIIHDSRPENKTPVTIMARTGAMEATADGQQVVVYDGSRQELNPDTSTLGRLDFKRYSIDLPEAGGAVRQRWREPDERTFWELLRPDAEDERDRESRREFMIEAHRRIISPLLAPAFAAVALGFLLLGALERRGQGLRVAAATAVTVTLQGLYLAAFSMARDSSWGLVLMYAIALLPLAGGCFLLSAAGEDFVRRLRTRQAAAA